MDPQSLREKMRVISRCERQSWFFAHREGDSTTRSARVTSFVANLEGKRRQIIERLLDRTLASYLDSSAEQAGEEQGGQQ